VRAGELVRAVEAPLPSAAITRVAHLMNSHQNAASHGAKLLMSAATLTALPNREREKRGANHGGRCYICSCCSQSQQETEQEEDERRRHECSSAHDVADRLPFPRS
jgi:hypothetical protein